MTFQEQIDFIRQKCIEANPEITYLRAGCATLEDDSHYRPIRLADVLLAIREVAPDAIKSRENEVALLVRYDLRKDDLIEQSDECITFLTAISSSPY